MGGRRLIPVFTALVVLVASAASAAPAEELSAHRGFGGSVDTTTPAGGSSTITSDGAPPPRLDTIDVLLGADISDTQTYKAMVFTLASFKSKSKRTVACAMMAGHSLEQTRDRLITSDLSDEDIQVAAETRALAYALACMRIARLMAEIEAEAPARPAGRAAARKCDVAPVALKVRTTRSEDGQYVITPVGNAKAGEKALPAKVTCKGTSSSMRVRVTAKTGDVRKAVGGPVQVGIISPSDVEDDAHIRVGFKK